MIVFHHSAHGSNGKSTLFALVARAFGELHESCQATMLNAASKTAAGGANEELMSTRGKRLVQLTELCSREKLSAASIKGLTGGDEQSARGLYQRKQKFVCTATLHLLCNGIPEVNDGDGGTMRRLRSVPYGSRFVEKDAAEGEEEPLRGGGAQREHVYAREDVATRMDGWKYWMMEEVMRAAMRRVDAQARGEMEVVAAPESVKRSTRELVERESTVRTFMEGLLERTGLSKDRLTLAVAYAAYEEMCRGGKAAERKVVLKAAMLEKLGPFARESNGWRNYWREWKLIEDGPVSNVE